MGDCAKISIPVSKLHSTLIYPLGRPFRGNDTIYLSWNIPEVPMPVREIFALIIVTFWALGFTAVPAYCDNLQAQEQQVFSNAVKMALKIKPLPADEIIDISLHLRKDVWNKSEASAKALFKHARDTAACTNSAVQYRSACNAANYLLMSLDRISSQEAQKLFESWPAPLDFEQQYKDFSNKFEADKQRNRLLQNPSNYVNEYIPPENMNTWSALISRFFSRPDDARKVFDRMLRECEAQSGRSSSTPRVVSKIMDPNSWDASLFRHYIDLLKHDRWPSRYELSCDGKSTMLDDLEGDAFQILMRVAQSYFSTATEMLQVAPSLKEKMDRVGGFNSILDHGEFRGGPPYVGRPILYRGYKGLKAKIDTLCDQSRNEVLQTVAALKSARDFDSVSWAASASCATVSEVASNVGREMVLNEPEAETRISMASRLVPGYGARLQPEWIEFGFNVLRATDGRSSSTRSEFEKRFVGQVALIDFKRAISYINKAKQPLDRLRMLIAVMDVLESELWRTKQSVSFLSDKSAYESVVKRTHLS